MSLKFKSLGVALAAVLAMGALVAAVASATNVTGHFTKAGSTLTIVTGEQGAVAHVFAAGQHREVVCPVAHFVGEQTVTKSETATITPTYSGRTDPPPGNQKTTCKAGGLEGTTVNMNGCDYLFNGTKGTVQIKCPGAVKSITVEAKVAGVLKCTIHIPEQTLGGITYTNNNAHPGNTSTITVTANVTGITYTTTKGVGAGACEETNIPDGKDGTYKGSVTVHGTALAVAEGIWIT
jgi:redox-regulated HSP33 family molecular chaperone